MFRASVHVIRNRRGALFSPQHLNQTREKVSRLRTRTSASSANVRIANEPSKRSAWTTVLFFGIPVATTFSLGVWQVQRLGRKKELIAQRKLGMHSEPMTELQLNTSDDLDYKRISLSGTFLHEKEMLVGPRSAPKQLPSSILQWGGTSGFLVITPFRTSSGQTFLVNRGWIPQRLTNPQKRVEAKISPIPLLSTKLPTASFREGECSAKSSSAISFLGVVRIADEKNIFMPQNRPEANDWFYVDVAEMMKAQGLDEKNHNFNSRDVPFIELLEPLPSNGWPYPRSFDDFLQFRTPPSTHITYATTWFSLSIALALLSRNRLKSVSRRQ